VVVRGAASVGARRRRAGQRARAQDGGTRGSERGRETMVEKARQRWRTR
jgi:hypothetical protein